MPTRTRLDAESRRSQILEVARALFSARPYADVTLADVAAASEVTRANLHYHFGTKRELYVAVVTEFVRLPPLPAGHRRRGTIKAQVHRTISGWLDTVSDQQGTFAAILSPGQQHLDPEIAAVLERGREDWAARMVTLLEIEDTPRTRALIRAWQSMAEASIDEWLVRGRLDREDVQRLLEDGLVDVASRVA